MNGEKLYCLLREQEENYSVKKMIVELLYKEALKRKNLKWC